MARVMADNVSPLPDNKSEQQEAIHYTHVVLDDPRPDAPESPCAAACRTARATRGWDPQDALLDAAVSSC